MLGSRLEQARDALAYALEELETVKRHNWADSVEVADAQAEVADLEAEIARLESSGTEDEEEEVSSESVD